jgi:hypothetical protein
MTISYLHYRLLNGFVQNWLAAGPQVLQVEGTVGASSTAFRQEIAQQFYVPDLEIKNQPVVRGKLTEGIFTIGEYRGSWEYVGCLEDHLVNHSSSFPSISYLRSWAYTQLHSKQEIDVQLRLATSGPADLWVNRIHLLRKDTFCDQQPDPQVVKLRLKRGPNRIFVRFENLAVRDCAHFMSLQVCQPDGVPLDTLVNGDGNPVVSVRLSTTIMPGLIELRNRMEQLFAGISLERDVLERDHELVIYLPDAPYAEEIVTIRVMDAANIIFRDGALEGKPGQRIPLNYAFELTGGRYQVELLPRVWEYYELNMRIKKDMPVWTVGNTPYSTEMYGTYPERRQEGLLKAVEQVGNLYAEVAKMALNWWPRVERKTILAAIDRVNQRLEGSVLQLAGLLGMLYRFADNPDFPGEIRRPLEDCIQNFRYGVDEPGHDAQDFDRESSQILFHTCELLAGQRFPDQVFPNDGQTGQWHFQNGSLLASAWMLDRANLGFEDWGSCEDLTLDLIALSLLVDLAEDSQVQELAMVLMDKIFFSLALNSYRGILGTAQRRVSPSELKGGILQPTAGITRLMWGMGVFNHRIEGYVSLACMEQYEFPVMIADIAANLPEEMWGREQHAGGRSKETIQPVNKVTYRTPDYMLSSAQDYLPGSNGSQELVWQATLGPSAIVFVTNPGCSFDEQGMAPGYWVGNAHLPRVAQWKNALIAFYNLPTEDWMGFTHAYFPTRAFDEYVLRDRWAFVRKGNGYLAITSSAGMELVTQGPHAFKELRAPGRQVGWLCHMGRAVQDGDFSSFQERILGLPVQFDGLSVNFNSLQGEELSFGSDRAFLVNGNEVPLSGYPHYENPYSVTPLNAGQMDIVYNDSMLRLDFSTQPDE